jgi:uncharacterized membrane protein
MHYFPLALPFLLAFAFVILIVLGLIEVGILRYAYGKIGVSHRYMFVLLLGSLLGSYVNIPVATLPAQQISSDQVFSYFGMQHIIPNIGGPPRTILAVNLGGAVIPTILSLYLVIRNYPYLQGPLKSLRVIGPGIGFMQSIRPTHEGKEISSCLSNLH